MEKENTSMDRFRTEGSILENSSAMEILCSVEEQILQLHTVMTAGMSSGWKGEAFEAYCEAEGALFQESEDVTGRLRVALRDFFPHVYDTGK